VRVGRIVIALIVLGIVSACSAKSEIPYSDLPEDGDAMHGEQLFNTQVELVPSCASCHNDEATVSPELAGVGERAATRVEGQSAREYLFYSITEPRQYIVEGYGDGMYNDYDETFSPQDIADLIAYLEGL